MVVLGSQISGLTERLSKWHHMMTRLRQPVPEQSHILSPRQGGDNTTLLTCICGVGVQWPTGMFNLIRSDRKLGDQSRVINEFQKPRIKGKASMQGFLVKRLPVHPKLTQ